MVDLGSRTGGRMAALIRGADWSATPLGPAADWPSGLQQAVSMCLEARAPALIWWGPDGVLLHNDAHLNLLHPATRHAALGKCRRAAWPEAWPELERMFECAWTKDASGSWTVEHRIVCQTNGVVEERTFVFTYVAIRDDAGRLGGVFGVGTDVTASVLVTRRLQILEELSGVALDADTRPGVCLRAAEVLARCSDEMPFALAYLRDPDSWALQLVATAGVPPADQVELRTDAGMTLSPQELDSADGVVAEIGSQASDPTRTLPAVHQAYVRTFVRGSDHHAGGGCIVVGLHPLRPFDADTRAFFDRVGDRIAQALHHAADCETAQDAMRAAAEADSRRAALLDRIAHELRTPLNAILGWAQVLETGIPAPDVTRKGIEAIQRNAWRQKHALDDLASIGSPDELDGFGAIDRPVTGAPPNLSGLSILVVDDEPDMRTLLRHVFADAGAGSVLAASVQQAMACVARQRPDLIVSDIGLPGENGYQLLRRLRALPPALGGDIPAIALTASMGDDDARQAFEAGFELRLQKPVDRQQLLNACARLVQRRRSG